jgi:hypothetical protein
MYSIPDPSNGFIIPQSSITKFTYARLSPAASLQANNGGISSSTGGAGDGNIKPQLSLQLMMSQQGVDSNAIQELSGSNIEDGGIIGTVNGGETTTPQSPTSKKMFSKKVRVMQAASSRKGYYLAVYTKDVS